MFNFFAGGFVKLRYFNTITGTDALVITPISQASAKQRAGNKF